MITLEEYKNDDGTYTSPRNNRTYKSLTAFRAHWYYNSDRFKAAKSIFSKETCSHCNKELFKCGFKSHEKSCYLNPVNVKLCKQCNEPIKKYMHTKGTCSRSCSNIYFSPSRTKPEKFTKYRPICFHYHEKKCIVCSEDIAVIVHHNDRDHGNTDPENLIPLCPNHHFYVHNIKHKHLVQPVIDEYIKKFKNNRSVG